MKVKLYTDAILEGCFTYSYEELVAFNYLLRKVTDSSKELITIRCANSEFAACHPEIPFNFHSLVSSIQKKPITAFFDAQLLDSEELSVITKIQSSLNDNEYFTVHLSAEISNVISEFSSSLNYLQLVDLSKLNSRIAFCLYYWVSKKMNRESKINELDTITLNFNIDELKLKSALKGKYERWDKFKDDILIPAIESINHHTSLSLKWSPIKEARRIIAIKLECNRSIQLAP